jgi:outer membrane protein assembly factor BamB
MMIPPLRLAVRFLGLAVAGSGAWALAADRSPATRPTPPAPPRAAVPSVASIGTNLGVQVRKATIFRSDVGRDKDGRPVLYTVLLGAPAVLNVVDLATARVVAEHPLPGTSGAWGVNVAPDGTVYLGAYNRGYLYRYFPETGRLKNLGHPFKTPDAVLYPMAIAPGGKVYGGSYPSGHAYEYDPDKGAFRDLGDMTDNPAPERWIRVTVHDPATNKLYFGIGNRPQLVEYDLATGGKRDLLPSKYSNITAVYDLNVESGRLFCRKETHNPYEYFVLDQRTGDEILVTNADTGEKSPFFVNASRGVSPKSPVANKVYYAALDRHLYEYDLDANSIRKLPANVQGAITGYAWLKLDDPDWPGDSLVGTVGNGGFLFRFNPQTGRAEVRPAEYAGQPVNIHDVEAGPDGRIYSGGYLAGNMGIFDPATRTVQHMNGSGQTEGMVFVGHKLYMGVYPNAHVYEYDTRRPWDPGSAWAPQTPGDRNPNPIFSLEHNPRIPGYTDQDRPFAMAGSDELGLLFVGTVPKNGMLGGALAVWDVNRRGDPDVHWNLVPDQSITSLAYKDGLLYGGTSVYGGMGAIPTAKAAELFVWDVAKRQKVFSTVPVPGKPAITQLHVGPDGQLWGLTGGTLFVFDPATRQVVHRHNHFPSVAGHYRDGSLLTGKDGHLYGTVGGRLFRVDPATRALTVLATGADKLACGADGRLYVSGSPITELHQVDPASLAP